MCLMLIELSAYSVVWCCCVLSGAEKISTVEEAANLIAAQVASK